MPTSDLRYALRTFRREPAFVLGVVLTFALVIGPNAAMFGLVRRLMLTPPPGIRNAESVFLVAVTQTTPDGQPFTAATTSYPMFRALSALGSAFEAVAAFQEDSVTVGQGADLIETAAVKATGRYFAALGVQPVAGRLFDDGDDALPNGNDVVVLSHGYWLRRFAGSAGAIGTPIVVDGQSLTVELQGRRDDLSPQSEIAVRIPDGALMRLDDPAP